MNCGDRAGLLYGEDLCRSRSDALVVSIVAVVMTTTLFHTFHAFIFHALHRKSFRFSECFVMSTRIERTSFVPQIKQFTRTARRSVDCLIMFSIGTYSNVCSTFKHWELPKV